MTGPRWTRRDKASTMADRVAELEQLVILYRNQLARVDSDRDVLIAENCKLREELKTNGRQVLGCNQGRSF